MLRKDSDHPKTFKYYVELAASFATAKIAALTLRHPIHVIQAKRQAKSMRSTSDIIRGIYKEGGVKNFYQGLSSSITKILVSEIYRGTLMIEGPALTRKYLLQDTSLADSKFAGNMCATPWIAAIDAAIICPFLKVNTDQLTRDKKASALKIFSSYVENGQPLKKLYAGYNMVWFQTAKGWGTFFGLYDLNKFVIKKWTGGEVSYSAMTVASVANAVTQNAFNHVLDTIRVRKQMENYTEKNAREVFKELVKTKSTFAGFSLRLISASAGHTYKNLLMHYWENKEDVKAPRSSR